MKSYGQLWDRIVSDDNLHEAWRRFRRHHASQRPVVFFAADLERNLAAIGRALREGTWRPGAYHQFKIYEPKPRLISCVSVGDRLVHHALCNVIAPLMERRFIARTYACREGKGSHLACRDARRLAGRHRYFLKLDIRRYFDSIDHGILLGLTDGMFRERTVRDLIARIVTKPIPHMPPRVGVPIGNLTSQWFANFYLDGLDHLVAEDMGAGDAYLRYMDDLLVFADTKARLWAIHDAIAAWIGEKRRLRLKEEATVLAPTSEGVPYLGLRIFPQGWRFRHARWQRTRRSARRQVLQFAEGQIDAGRLSANLKAMDGAARWFGFKGVYRFVDDYDLDSYDIHDLSVPGDENASGNNRSNRGGGFNNDFKNASASYRNNNNANNANDNVGFRLASICQDTQQGKRLTGQIPSREPALRARAETNMPPGGSGRVGASAPKVRAGRPLLHTDFKNANRGTHP